MLGKLAKQAHGSVTLNSKGEIERYNIEEQCHSVFTNIKYILEDSGSSWDNIVDVQVFLTNMKDDFKTYNCRSTFFIFLKMFFPLSLFSSFVSC